MAGGACRGVAVRGESGCQVLQRPPGRVGSGQQAGRVGVALAGRGEHAEQLDAVAGVHPVTATVPLRGGLADQVLAGGELTPVPCHDALGIVQRGGGDRLAAAAELRARLGHSVRRRGCVTGDGGQARQGGQGGGNEHDALDAPPAVGRPAERADSGRGVAPGRDEAGLGQRGDVFHQPDGTISSCSPTQSDLRLGRVELAQGGEQLRPAAPHDRLGEAVRMRRYQVRGLIQRGHGGGLDARSGDRARRRDGQREGQPFLARRRPGELDREQAVPLLLGQVAGQEGCHGQQALRPRRERRIGLAG